MPHSRRGSRCRAHLHARPAPGIFSRREFLPPRFHPVGSAAGGAAQLRTVRHLRLHLEQPKGQLPRLYLIGAGSKKVSRRQEIAALPFQKRGLGLHKVTNPGEPMKPYTRQTTQPRAPPPAAQNSVPAQA